MIVYMFVNNLDFLKFCFIYEEILNLFDTQLNLTLSDLPRPHLTSIAVSRLTPSRSTLPIYACPTIEQYFILHLTCWVSLMTL